MFTFNKTMFVKVVLSHNENRNFFLFKRKSGVEFCRLDHVTKYEKFSSQEVITKILRNKCQ